MSDGPAVSVVVVNHTRRAELALTLKALEYQRYRRFEVVVVSDMAAAERPPSPLGIRWLGFADANISAARNLGLAAARGDLIAFIDDDAQPEFGWLAALVPAFTDSAVGAAGGWTRGRNGVRYQWRTVLFDAAGRDVEERDDPVAGVHPPRAERFVKTVGTNAMFRRSALAEVGGFDAAFRFYLDEADLNLRLSRAGWSTAIVPRAEVHHGFAAGPHRTRLRVPRDLFEIGASQACFAARHWHGADPGPGQRAEQARRLDRLFRLGLLSAARLRWLLARYDAGRAAGASRRAAVAPVDPAAGDIAGQPARAAEPRVLTARLGGLARARRAAADHAARGGEVTLIAEDLPWRPLTVRFVPEGYFEHRIGLLGRVPPERARALPGFGARAAAERLRIATTRGR